MSDNSSYENDLIWDGFAQDLIGFTAQVRRNKTEVVGTAFVVDAENVLLMTCHHVARDALAGEDVTPGAKLYVYFQQIRGNDTDKKLFSAQVHSVIEEYDDDIVLLQLEQETLPPDVKVAVLGDAKRSVGRREEHRFRAFGYQRLGRVEGFPSRGIIVDFAMPADGQQYKPLTLETQGVDEGMSGAAVLDLNRNLVVGVISETSIRKLKNQDISFAVQSDVAHQKWDVPLHNAYQLAMTADLPVDKQARETAEAFAPNINFPLPAMYKPTQPPELPEWVGREEFLSKLDKDYADESVHITGLIGFGGEGKSSIAYRWLTKNALTGDNTPDATFWWSFYENRSFEQMVEALIEYLYGAQNLERIKGTGNRVNYIGAMALTRRLILVLDGFEVMQEEEGDKYGTLPNKDMLRLLELFALTHTSYCLVTSDTPLIDFINHSAYQEREIFGLSLLEGRQLLRNLNIEGDNASLDRIVSDWEGHALTISLLSSYLREFAIPPDDYSKEVTFPGVVEFADEVLRYRQVRRILGRYDEKLTDADKAFLKLFAVFRLPVAESAFDRVFRAETGSSLNSELYSLDDSQFEELVQGLQNRRLIKKGERSYSAYPPVQRHYRKALHDEHKPDDLNPVHKAIAEHYQETSSKLGNNPTLDDLKPYIEVVHHLCSAGAYDEAFDIYWSKIQRGESQNLLIHHNGAINTEYELMLEFFPDDDLTQEPEVSKDSHKRFILNEIGLSLVSLGRLRKAAPFYDRVIEGDLQNNRHRHASLGYHNLASLYMKLGELGEMQEVAEKSLSEAKQVENDRNRKQFECDSYGLLAQATHLLGEMETAGEYFKSAEKLGHEIDPAKHYLYSSRGIHHADHLRRIGDRDYAWRVTEANLEICQRNGWIDKVSQIHRVLGDLEADAGNHERAQEHDEQAIAIAGQIDNVDVKIEAYLARGRWYAKHMKDAEKAYADLDFALSMVVRGEYRLYEADIRVALAWAHKVRGDVVATGREAGQALAMSIEMGYHWGQVDAKEVLEAV